MEFLLNTKRDFNSECLIKAAANQDSSPYIQGGKIGTAQVTQRQICTAPVVLQSYINIETCDMLVSKLRQLKIQTGESLRASTDYKISMTAWVPDDEIHSAIFDLVTDLFLETNTHYGFDITGLVDAPQYCQYGVGSKFDWHLDNSELQTTLRKLSLSIQLSNNIEYAGGNLEFCPHGSFEHARERGTVIVFPSYLAHRVTPVTAGRRESLVAWAYGPSFR